jgi:hypothetical protein
MPLSSLLARALIPFGAVAILAACGSSAAAPASSTSRSATSSSASDPSARCGPAQAQTLAAGPRSRVFASGGTVSACVSGRPGTVRLGSSGSCIRANHVGPVAVAGVLVALASERCGVDTGSTVVQVKRLPAGRTLFSHLALASPGPESYTSVGSIVVAGNGGVAWIAHGGSIVAQHSVTEVVAKTPTHGTRVLDHGAGIVLASLRLSGSRISWRDGSSRHSASLG